MSAISAWLLSIAGIILISVIVEIIMPEGQTNKYIKGILALFTVFVIVLPLPGLNLGSINFNNWFNGGAGAVDDNFIKNVNQQKIAQYEEIIESTLNDNGYQGVAVTIDADPAQTNMQITGVEVNLSLLVLTSDQLNINKYDKITAIICGMINVKKEQIMFYDGG